MSTGQPNRATFYHFSTFKITAKDEIYFKEQNPVYELTVSKEYRPAK